MNVLKSNEVDIYKLQKNHRLKNLTLILNCEIRFPFYTVPPRLSYYYQTPIADLDLLQSSKFIEKRERLYAYNITLCIRCTTCVYFARIVIENQT